MRPTVEVTLATAKLLSADIPGWAPGTNLYSTSDGKYLAVEAMPIPEETTQIVEPGQSPQNDELLAVLGESYAALKVVVRPTIVFLSNADGVPVDADENDYDPMTPLHRFDPGTSHTDALKELGYKV